MSSAKEQVTRLLLLAPYLQARRGVRLAQVARDFGVKPETIVADLRVLWMCGLPGLGPGDMIDIDFEAFQDDPDGVVRIDNAEYLSRPVRLGSSEASALIVALRALREGSPEAPREVIDRALAKLEDAATLGGTAPVQVHLPESRHDVLVLRELRRAVAEDRQARLDYYVPSRDESTHRTVDPLALLSAEGRTYLDAWCHLAEARRLFRVDRVLGVEVLADPRATHDVPPRDLSEGLFQPGPDDVVARLRLPRPLRWVADYYPVLAREELDDGAVLVELAVGDPQWLVRLVLQLGGGAEVIAPQPLRERTTSTAKAALALYVEA